MEMALTFNDVTLSPGPAPCGAFFHASLKQGKNFFFDAYIC